MDEIDLVTELVVRSKKKGILARVGALRQMDYLSMLAGFTLPKGSTHVTEALLELKKRELEFIRFVKVDFKNVKEFLG